MKMFNEVMAELVKNTNPEIESIVKSASLSLQEEQSDGNLVNDITSLASKLKRNGFVSLAEELNENLFVYKIAQMNYNINPGSTDAMLDMAHEGDVEVIPAQEWYGYFQTDRSAQRKMLESVKRPPKGLAKPSEFRTAIDELSENVDFLGDMDSIEESADEDLQAVASMLIREAQENVVGVVNKKIDYIRTMLRDLSALYTDVNSKNESIIFTRDKILSNPTVAAEYEKLSGQKAGTIAKVIDANKQAFDQPAQGTLEQVQNQVRNSSEITRYFIDNKFITYLHSPDRQTYDNRDYVYAKAIYDALVVYNEYVFSKIDSANKNILLKANGREGGGGLLEKLKDFISGNLSSFRDKKLETATDLRGVTQIAQANYKLHTDVKDFKTKYLSYLLEILKVYSVEQSAWAKEAFGFLFTVSDELAKYIANNFNTDNKPKNWNWDSGVVARRYAEAAKLWDKYRSLPDTSDDQAEVARKYRNELLRRKDIIKTTSDLINIVAAFQIPHIKSFEQIDKDSQFELNKARASLGIEQRGKYTYSAKILAQNTNLKKGMIIESQVDLQQLTPPPPKKDETPAPSSKPPPPKKDETPAPSSKPAGAAYTKPQGQAKPSRPTDEEKQAVSVMQNYLSNLAIQILDNTDSVLAAINKANVGSSGTLTKAELESWAKQIQDTGQGTRNKFDGKFGANTSRSIDIAKTLANRIGRGDIASALVEKPSGTAAVNFLASTAEQNTKAANINWPKLQELTKALNLSIQGLPEAPDSKNKKIPLLDQFNDKVLTDANVESPASGKFFISLKDLLSIENFYSYVKSLGLMPGTGTEPSVINNPATATENNSKKQQDATPPTMAKLKNIANEINKVSDVLSYNDIIALAQDNEIRSSRVGTIPISDDGRAALNPRPAQRATGASAGDRAFDKAFNEQARATDLESRKLNFTKELEAKKKMLTVDKFDSIIKWFFNRANTQYARAYEGTDANLASVKAKYMAAMQSLARQWNTAKSQLLSASNKPPSQTFVSFGPEGSAYEQFQKGDGGSRGRGRGVGGPDGARGRAGSSGGSGGFNMPRSEPLAERAIKNPPIQYNMNIVNASYEWGSPSIAEKFQFQLLTGQISRSNFEGADIKTLFDTIASIDAKDTIAKGSGGMYRNRGIWLMTVLDAMQNSLATIYKNWLEAVDEVSGAEAVIHDQNTKYSRWTAAIRYVKDKARRFSEQEGSSARERPKPARRTRSLGY